MLRDAEERDAEARASEHTPKGPDPGVILVVVSAAPKFFASVGRPLFPCDATRTGQGIPPDPAPRGD